MTKHFLARVFGVNPGLQNLERDISELRQPQDVQDVSGREEGRVQEVPGEGGRAGAPHQVPRPGAAGNTI